MALSRGELLSALRVQVALATGRSPLTAAVLRCCARALEEAAPGPLQAALLGTFAQRKFAHPWEAPLLIAAALHYQVLGLAPGRAPGPGGEAEEPLERLRALYPSVGGRFSGTPVEEEALWRALGALARHDAPDWRWFLAEGSLQLSEPGRALCWLAPAQALQARRPLPLDLLELGAGAGLLLVGDGIDAAGVGLGVEQRLGVDLAPLDVGEPRVRRALRACVWADQVVRLRRLDRALERLLQLRQAGRGPTVLAGEMVQRLPDAMGLLRAQAGAGPRRLIIYSALASTYLDDDAYDRLRARVRAGLRAWPGPALFVELEPARGATDATLWLTAYRLRGEALEALPLGRMPPHPEPEEPWERDTAGWRHLLAED